MRQLYFSKKSFFGSLLIIGLLFVEILVSDTVSDLVVYSRISVIVVLISFIILFWKSHRFSEAMLFYICLIVMHCGQIVMIALGLEAPYVLSTSVAISNNLSMSKEAISFVTISCLLVSFVIFFLEKQKRKKEICLLSLQEESEIEYKISSYGWIVIILIVLLTVVSDLTRMMSVRVLGYAKGYHQTNIILYYADFLFPLTYFAVISVYHDNWKYLRVVLLIVVAHDLFSMFMIGSRGEAVLDLIMIAFSISKITNSNAIKTRIKRIFLSFCIIGVIALPFSGLLRADRSLSLSEFFSLYNPISYALTEFGGSIVNVRLAIIQYNSLPVVDFFLSFVSILPLSTYVFPSLVTSYGNTYASFLNIAFGGGLGGSVIGEGYFWFGLIGGLVYIGVYACFVVCLINSLSGQSNKSDIVKTTVRLFLLYELFLQIRGSISSFQAGTKIVLYFWVLMTLFKNQLFIKAKAERR